MEGSWRLNLFTISTLTWMERRNWVSQQLNSIMLHNFCPAKSSGFEKLKLLHHAATGGCQSRLVLLQHGELTWFLGDLWMMVTFFSLSLHASTFLSWDMTWHVQHGELVGCYWCCYSVRTGTSGHVHANECIVGLCVFMHIMWMHVYVNAVGPAAL